MADYRLLYTDFPEGTIIGELPIIDCDYELSLNAAGRFGATVPIRDRSGNTIASPESLAVARTGLFLERDDVLLWGGILWRATADVLAGTLSLEAEGFHSYFERRYLTSTFSMSGEQLVIARAYFNTAQAVPGGNINLGFVPHSTPINRTRVHAYFERKNVIEAFEQLASVENGFDWYYTWTRTSGVITPTLLFQYPATGRVTDFVFETGTNCAALSYSEDGTGIVNRVDAIGSGEGADRRISTASNAPLIGPYPLLEDIVNVSDVSDVNVLSQHAKRRLQRGAGPIRTITVTTFADIEPAIGSYFVGDRVTVRADEGWAQVNDRFRIVQVKLRLLDGGEEVVITLVDVAVFDAL